MPGARSYKIRDWNDVERSFRVVASTPRPLKCSEWDPKAGDKDDQGRPMGAMVDYWEALEGWNFERFALNNLIFESHRTDDSDAVIGLGSDYKTPPDGSLELKVTLAPTNVNPRTGVLEPRIRGGYLRGVSVGWDYGDRSDEMRDGRMTRVYRNNVLTEVSLCPIPADEDSLVDAGPDEETRRRERLGNAARELAKQRRARTDATDNDVERFDFFGTVGKFTRTQVGGIRVPARLTRTGILEYKRPDGTIRRELRLPEEVFNTDSLASLQGATVTDLSNHRGLLSLDDWKDATRGHTEAVRRDGKFVQADLLINDPTMVADIENDRLRDISCGYSCKLDATPGTYEGKPYDVIQRRIRYNHVAVLPKGRGRAGVDVAIRTDSNDADCVELTDKDKTMTQRVIRIDGKNLDFGSEEHIALLENGFAATLKPVQEKAKELQTRCDTLETERDTARTDAAKSLADLKEEKDGEKAKFKRKARSKMLRKAIRLLASDDEDDEEKTDALEDELDALTDKELQIKVIRTDAKYADGKAGDGTLLEQKSDDYVSAIFDAVCRSGVTRADGIDSVVQTLEIVKRTDAKNGGKDAADIARDKMNATAQAAWKQPLS